MLCELCLTCKTYFYVLPQEQVARHVARRFASYVMCAVARARGGVRRTSGFTVKPQVGAAPASVKPQVGADPSEVKPQVGPRVK